ncbi:MAG: FAD-binding oxidoreductase [Rhodobacteraceae bacterium]|nr:FAD-binding oxidoreductase [uncultured Defluviimonas sp.]MCB2125070.1 FAD-binding oxidoreductase [Paracoccaceae bacterium]MCC0068430.1 FAD-binding oxidoreductase [Paracoccaceae bacterium]
MALLDDLAALLGPQGCLAGDRVPEAARSDMSRSGRALPRALLRPATVEEVSRALALCHAVGQTVVPQGGMTGLAGGANPRADDVALSLQRLTGIEEIDREAATMTLKAGTVLQTAQEAAAEAGFLFPVDLGARGSCTVGGNIATNAGGLRVIRDGMTRDNILGLEVALADGTVLTSLGKTVKNNTGYDLRHLFAGSEGTLGVVTRAVFRLRPLPRARATALCALASYADVLALLAKARVDLPGLSAFEAMWRDYFALNRALAGLRLFAEAPAFAVILEAQTDAEVLQVFLEGAYGAGLVADALVAQTEAEARDFWTVREGHAMDTHLPGLINLDVSMPVGRLDDFARACREALLARFPGAHVSFFGHVGDSNLHVAVALPGGPRDGAHAVDAIAYGLVRDLGGSVSAEHGIGTLKRDWLGHSRSPAEIAAMRAIKSALDPEGILNPGKVL